MNVELTELVFILDRSGSMNGLESDTIGGFNGMISKQKAEGEKVNVTTVLFDDEVEIIHDRFPIDIIEPLTDKEYYVRGNGSVYTGLLSVSIITNKNVHKGLLSLADINDEVQRMMKGWNEKNPEKVQHPIFRSSMGGTIYFPVEEYHPYKQKQFFKETRTYTIVRNCHVINANNFKIPIDLFRDSLL